MSEVNSEVIDLIYGRWRSQTLYAGVELGVFDHLASNSSKQAQTLATELHVDASLLYGPEGG